MLRYKFVFSQTVKVLKLQLNGVDEGANCRYSSNAMTSHAPPFINTQYNGAALGTTDSDLTVNLQSHLTAAFIIFEGQSAPQ